MSLVMNWLLVQIVTQPLDYCGCVAVKSRYPRCMDSFFFFCITYSFDLDFIDEVTACILKLMTSLINLTNSVYSLMIGF